MSHVLIVEDSATQAARLEMALDEAGYETKIATDVDSALALLATQPFDLVITDIIMPGKTGYELCKEIKGRSKWQNIPVILLTTRKDPMDIIKGLECGADSFFTKPYEPDRLIERIYQILYNRELRSQGKLRVGIEIAIFNKIVTISSEKGQILDLLITTFEDIVQTNRDLEKSKEELAAANAKIEEYVGLVEERAQTSEERYRAIFEYISDGIITFDTQGIIDSANPAAQHTFDYSGSDMMGHKISLLIPHLADADHVAFDDLIGHEMFESKGCRKDGTEFPISLNVSKMRIGNGYVYIGVTRDLTTEKEVELRLRQAEKMEAIGQLTGGLAHDFNNQLTVILGNADYLQEQLGTNEQLQSLASMISNAAQRGAELTQRLLAFSRRQALEPRILNANHLLGDMESLLRRTLGENIEVKLLRSKELWQAMVDPAPLENAILNLCINARDAMPGGGHLTIETTNTTFDQDYADQHVEVQPGEYVMIAVSDTGIGIPEDKLQQVFDPFFTTKEKGKGTGLGLSMVYGFLKQSKGHISIYSEQGHGTTIKLYLPRADIETEEGRKTRSDEAITGGTETILLVEDNELVRRYVQDHLVILGYKVIVAEQGDEALEIIRQRDDVDLLLTDVMMPGGMNGCELAGAAHELRPALKVLYTSGYTENVIISSGPLESGVHLLVKPYRREELARKIRAALSDNQRG